VPRWLAAAEEVRVIGLGATVGLQDTLNWLSQLSADPEGDATLIRRLVRLGIAARVLRHEFAPRY
jgi:hypothetical protein